METLTQRRVFPGEVRYLRTYEPFKKSVFGRTFCVPIVCSIVFVEKISKIPHSVTYTDERARAQIMRFYPP